MKVLHISYSYDYTDGGITTVVNQLVREQKKTQIKVEWLASNLFRNPFKRRKLIKEILKINPTIVHLHGLWRLHTRITSDLIKAAISYVITPLMIFKFYYSFPSHRINSSLNYFDIFIFFISQKIIFYDF